MMVGEYRPEQNLRRYEGKVAVVTGAARGLGRACALRFAREGAAVVLADIDGAKGRETLREFEGEGLKAHFVEADVSQRAVVDDLVAQAVERFGAIDIMVNNAGIGPSVDFLEMTEADFDRVLAVNLKAGLFGTQAAGRRMRDAGRGGVIINMSSINAILANPMLAAYAVSKAGLNQLTRTAAIALAPFGIRVVGIGPGTIMTELVERAVLPNPEARRMILSRTPAGRIGHPDEVAGVAAFLASDDASYMTGQIVYPDGGRLALNYVVPVKDEG